MKVETIGGKILAVTIIVCSLWTVSATGETNTYKFDPDQSTVVRSFLTSDTYTLVGAFQLTVDVNSGSFDWVDATFSDDPNLQTGDLRELFYMDEIVGDVVNDTTIEFQLPPGHPVLQSYDIHITVTFQNDQVHLAGYRNPLMVGEPGYTLDAVANEAIMYDLTVTVVSGHGTVEPISGSYPAGTVVTVTATPETGYYMRHWTGTDDDTSCSLTNTVTMDSDKTVTVEFGLPHTIHVPGQYATIQEAIDAAGCGDTVIVSTGVYYENINFNGKDIRVTSANPDDPNVVAYTIIQGTGTGPVVTFSGSESQSCMLDGLTITDGNTTGDGGGICGNGTEAAIANCVITNNHADGYGGGVSDCNGTIVRCTITGNTAGSGGGGMSNGSTWYEESSHPRITNCTFIGNRAAHGGGIFNEYSSPTLTNCVFIGNSADGNGGGMYNSSNPRLTNCTFSGNSAGYYGGIWNYPPPPGDGGASSVGGSSNIVNNCILWGNIDSRGMDESAQIGTFGIPLIINYSCVQGWTGTLGGTGNVGDNPLFVDSNGPDGIIGTEDDDLRLLPGSPCVDTGDNTAVPPSVLTDLDGNPRIVNGTVDMGAYEYQGPFKQCYYVDGINGDDNNDGLSPETAFATIQKGIDSAQNGDLVIVLPGTYTGSGNRDIDFKGKAITVRGENGPNNCIVDCEAQGRGFYFHTGENVDSVLEGLTIMNGGVHGMGAGIFCAGTSPSIRDCIIRNCSILGTGAGGGIYCDGSGPAIINCTIIDNTALEGGGIYLLNCSAMINSCTISRNGNYYSLGGGIYCRDSSPTITDCTITENDGDNGGGGMYCQNSSPTITDCTITENYGGNGGGGMYCEYGSLSISDCNFARNEADYGGGGGIICTDSNVAISRCTFSENGTDADYSDGGGAIHLVRTGGTVASCSFIDNETIGGSGAGIFCDDQSSPVISNCSFVSHRDDVVTCSDDSNPIIRDCSFTENLGTPIDISGSTPTVSHCEIVDNYMMAIDTGGACSPLIVNCKITGNDWGGVWIGGGSPTIVNCTIADNRKYAGIYCQGGHVNVHNSILWENTLLTGEPNSILLEGEATATVTHSDVQGGWPGGGNIDADPWFIDPHGDNYRVMPISQCINTGDNAAVPPTVLTDLDGNPRIVNSIVDMGAYEFQGIQILYVDVDAPHFGDGGSWATAFKYLQDALFNAVPPTEIRVAQGIYKPHLNTYSAAPPSRTDTFQLKNGVIIKGGYAGLGQPDPDARDISLYETVLSGDMNGDDEPNFVNNGENSYRVVTGSGTIKTALLDGFVVTAGNANFEDFSECNGAGMYNDHGSPTIMNCTFLANYAGNDDGGGRGGGMYNYNNSNPTITNCRFVENCAIALDGGEGHGGGMGNWYSNPKLTGCTFTGNTSGHNGGGIWNDSSDLVLVDCTFTENLAREGGSGSYGGGMYNYGCNVVLTNCIFSGNTARSSKIGSAGGGIHNASNSNVTMTNCIFSGNSAQSGGGIHNYTGTSVEVTNCIFAGNSAINGNAVACDSRRQQIPNNLRMTNCILWDGGDETWNNDGSLITITYSDIQGGWPGEGNIDADPCFVDPDGADNVVGTEDDNLRLSLGSPCVDTGDPGYVAEPNETDLDGNPRVIGGRIDMGAYEFFGPVYVDDDAPNDPGPGDPSVSDPLEDGTEAHPFDTIQEAVDLAVDGYIILVRQGLYFELTSGNSIDFLGKNITLTSSDPTDWDIVDNTVIGGYVQFSGTEGQNCKFTGFKISSLEGAIYGNHTHATISYCNISGNGACGVTVIKDCDGTISNCLITDNTTFALCGIYPVVFGCNGLIKNCTIANNESGLSVGTATIKNCIIYNNSGSQLAVTNGNTADISYSNVQNGPAGIAGDGQVNWGPGNIDADPCFVRLGCWIMDETTLVEGDYHLRSEGWRWNTEGKSWTYDFVTSRCVDAGNPGSLLSGELMSVPRDPDNIWGVNIRVNMGAYGGTGQASMPPHDWALLADLNNDGTANFVDFAYQAQDWLTIAPEQPGDLNRDGVLNTLDLTLLAEEWLRVTGLANQPPVVYITQPPDGCEFCWLTESVQIEADASDVDGSVVKVEFFVNGAKIGEDNNGTDGWLYVTSFNIGTYTLTAKATDNKGAKETSPPVKIKAVECQ